MCEEMTAAPTIPERVTAIIAAHFDIGAGNISVVTPLSELAADKLDVFEIGKKIEETFGFVIVDELCTSSTVGDFIALVERRLAEDPMQLRRLR